MSYFSFVYDYLYSYWDLFLLRWQVESRRVIYSVWWYCNGKLYLKCHFLKSGVIVINEILLQMTERNGKLMMVVTAK